MLQGLMESNTPRSRRRNFYRGHGVTYGKPVFSVKGIRVFTLFLQGVQATEGLPQANGAELGRRSHKVGKAVTNGLFQWDQTEAGRERVTLRGIRRL